MSDKRTFERHNLARLAFANSPCSDESQGGILSNISACGALIDLVFPLRKIPREFMKEKPVHINIDSFPPLTGRVARSTREIVAITFDLDGAQQTSLNEEISQALARDRALAGSVD